MKTKLKTMVEIKGKYVIAEITPKTYKVDVETTMRVKVTRARRGITLLGMDLEVENTDGKIYGGIAWDFLVPFFTQTEEYTNTFYTGKNPGEIKIRAKESKWSLFHKELRIKEELSFPVE